MVRRRFLPVLSVALLAVAAAALPAAAQGTGSSSSGGTAETYAASAQGSALTLSLLGQNITVGAGSASLDSTPKANASANGVLLLTTPVGASTATATKEGQNVSDGTPTAPTCGPLSLPSSVPVVGLTTACSFSQAAVSGGNPSATAGGQSLNLSLGTSSLTTLLPSLKSLVTQLNTTLSGVLGNILGPLTGGSITTGELGTLLNTLTTSPAAQLVTVQLGASTSKVTTTNSTVTADATSTGGTVCVGAIASICLVKVTIGQAEATAVRDRSANTATPTVNPSIITVQLLPALFDGLSQVPGVGSLLQGLFKTQNGTPTLTLQQGQEFTLPALGIDIVASSGATKKTSDGASASASSLKITLLSNVSGGVSLALADANAGVAGTAAVPGTTTAPSAPPASKPKKLAYTGANSSWQPLVAGLFVVLAIAGLEVARRARRRRVELE